MGYKHFIKNWLNKSIANPHFGIGNSKKGSKMELGLPKFLG